MRKLLSPSLLAADKNNLVNEVIRCNESDCDMIHFDVMDNVFVPNTSFNDDTFTKIRPSSKLNFEIHLMVQNPFDYIYNYEFDKNDVIIVHVESFNNSDDLLRCINEIKKTHKVGLSIKPNTSCNAIDEYLPLLDYILIMSVEPGFGGQKFMPSAIEKIAYFANKKKDFHYVIEVDGGINEVTNIPCFEAGLDIAVAGSYLFKGNMKEQVESIRCAK